MKIRADEHVSPCIVRIICDLAKSPEVELSSVNHTDQKGTADPHWVREFANEGGDAILSADTDFFKKPHQVVAIDDTGLRVIYLPPKWANAPGRLQAAHILSWWSRIEAKLFAAKPREFWVVTWNIREDGELKRKKVDYGSFRKKVRKADRKAGREIQKGRARAGRGRGRIRL